MYTGLINITVGERHKEGYIKHAYKHRQHCVTFLMSYPEAVISVAKYMRYWTVGGKLSTAMTGLSYCSVNNYAWHMLELKMRMKHLSSSM